MGDIKLFVCCHKESPVPKHPLLVPMQVGAALAERHFDDYIHDNTGDNISAKNRSYCELTAQYWAWKNCDAEYIGFFHYRRFLYPRKNEKRPYRIEKTPELELLKRLEYEDFSECIREYELIAPIGEDMHVPIREHYANAPYHHKEDMDLVEEIVRKNHPEMAEAMETYLSGTVSYFGNIFIMKQNLFKEYCGWLFPILEEYDRRSDKTGYSVQELRVNGYLAERLFGVWMTYIRPKVRAIELPRVHFIPDQKERVKKTVMNLLLPPSSEIRASVKKWMR